MGKSMSLGGNDTEIRASFDKVDTDRSGVIEYAEFVIAIRESRLSELGIQVVLNSIGVELDNVMATMQNGKGSFDALQKTIRRRAKQQRAMEEKVATLLQELVGSVAGETDGVELPKRDPKKSQLYNDLKDTFKAFDRDGNAQLIFNEYREAWKFLSLPGDANEIKKAFDRVDIDRSGAVDFTEFSFSIMGEDAGNYGYLADLEMLQVLLTHLVSAGGANARKQLEEAKLGVSGKDSQIAQLKAELDRLRKSASGDQFNDLVQRMMFKAGVTRIGPLTNDEMNNEMETIFAAAAGSRGMDRHTFKEVCNSKKMMELRLRKLVAEIEADFWLESKAPVGGEDESVSGRDLTTHHTAEEALHLRSFLRTSALVIQFCRRIQMKFSHADVEGSTKAAKALSHLLVRSQDELYEEIQRVKSLSGNRNSGGKYARSRGKRRTGSDNY